MRPRLPLTLWKTPPWPASVSVDSAGGAPSPPVILLYHSVAKVSSDPWGLRVSPRNFAEQMAVLRAHTNPMRLADLGEALDRGRIPDRSVVVTFDDGFADNLIHAKPAMARHSIPGTVFVSSGYVGATTEYWWDELDRILLRPGRVPGKARLTLNGKTEEWDAQGAARYSRLDAWKARRWRAWHERMPTARQRLFHDIWHRMRISTTAEREEALKEMRRWAGLGIEGRRSHLCCTERQLRELAAGGLIEIGGHTVTHPSLGAITVEQQRGEIFECKAALERMLGLPIKSFSYPFGSRSDYTADTIGLLKEAGFERTCSNFAGIVKKETDRFQYPRRVALDWTGAEFAAHLAKWFAERDES